MSLAELEQVAREAGLDPALVRRAAREIDEPAPPPPSRLAGAPMRIVLERTFEGELPADDHEPLVAEIRRSIGEPGLVSVLGRTMSWSASETGSGMHGGRRRSLTVTVTPRNGCTTLRIEESFTQLAGTVFGGLMGGLGSGGTGVAVGVGMGVLHSALAATGIMGGVLLVSYAGARGLYAVLVRRRRRQLELLRDRLSEGIEHGLEYVTRRGPGPGAGRGPERRLDQGH
ncbi:MAG: hypothetical protein ACYC2G_16150 [Gemmatimonadaceae bacterium]